MPSPTKRPRRSALYMPASNQRALEKSRGLPCDVVIVDLEDAVAPDAKSTARDRAASAIQEGGFGYRELVVRINALDTAWGEADLRMVTELGPDAVLLPKVSCAQQVRDVAEALSQQAPEHSSELWAMMETPSAILNAQSVAAAHPRLTCLVMGTSDLAEELHARHTRDRLPLLTSLGLSVLAARAHGLSVLDGVHLALDDEAGLRFACEQGRDLGFDGKTLIHPRQIDVCNAVFRPTPTEIARAEETVEAFADARRNGRSVVVVRGRLVEELHVREAERTLALHRTLLAREEPAIAE